MSALATSSRMARSGNIGTVLRKAFPIISPAGSIPSMYAIRPSNPQAYPLQAS